MGFAQLLQVLLSLVPAVLETVKAVEKAYPGKGKGRKKLAVVLSTVTAAAKAAPVLKASAKKVRDGVRAVRAGKLTPEAIEQVSGGVTAIVATAVQAFNETGVFKSDTFPQGGGD